jgi:hypothetical protein
MGYFRFMRDEWWGQWLLGLSVSEFSEVECSESEVSWRVWPGLKSWLTL